MAINVKRDFRLDHFLIWGHGIRFLTGIMDTINESSDVDILAVEKKKIYDMNEFIERVYTKEWPSVPKEHTLSKTRFLLDSRIPNYAAIILVMNKNPQVRIQENKDPRFRMPESGTIKEIKTKIRERFDPNKGGRGLIPLIPGRHPDQHIVHASDFEEQVTGILEVFGMKEYDSWFAYWKNKYEPPCRTNVRVETVSLENVFLRLLNPDGGTHPFSIVDSPHYRFLKGESEPYEQYWERFMGIYLKEDHTPATFRALAQDFEYLRKPYTTSYVRVSKRGNKYFSIDGDHRLCILKEQGKEKIKVEVT